MDYCINRVELSPELGIISETIADACLSEAIDVWFLDPSLASLLLNVALIVIGKALMYTKMTSFGGRRTRMTSVIAAITSFMENKNQYVLY